MLTVSEKASNMIKDFLEKQQGPSVVRIFLQPGCCGGATLGMALDEPGEDDATFIDQGITFAIDKALFESVKPIGIDFVDSPGGSGFMLASNLPGGGGCSSGGDGCSSGGCC